MAKAKEPEQNQEEASERVEGSSESEHESTLAARVQSLEERLARVEQMAHTDHSITPEAVDHLTQHVMGHVHEHLRKTTGQSGLPVRGDQ